MYSNKHEDKRRPPPDVCHTPSAASCSGMSLPYSYTPSGTLNLDTLKKALERKQLHEAAKEILEELETSATLEGPPQSKTHSESEDPQHCSAKRLSFSHGDQPRKTEEDPLKPLAGLEHLLDTPVNWKNVARPRKTSLWKTVKTIFTHYINPDFFVKIGKHLYNCHLLVLQSYSTYFGQYKYGETAKLNPECVTPNAFHVIYDWMLQPAEEVVNLLNKRNVLDIFAAAQYLGISELEQQCWSFVDCTDIFSEETALLMYLQAKEKNNESVMYLMLPRIVKSFLPLVSTPEFDRMPVDVVCKLLSSSFIAVHAEVEVLMAAVKWLMADWEQRRQHVVEVMECVRFGFMGPWQLVDLRRNPLNPEIMAVTNIPEVEAMIERSMEYAVHRYRYGDQPDEYRHWVELLDLAEPAPRNWIGKEHTYITFQQFLRHLETYQGLYGNSERLGRTSAGNQSLNQEEPVAPSAESSSATSRPSTSTSRPSSATSRPSSSTSRPSSSSPRPSSMGAASPAASRQTRTRALS